MPAGNFFLYLNHDDHTDMRALATIESVSRPLRGEFIRTASIAGAVLYRIDVRLPAMLGAMFVGTISPSQFSGILSLLRGEGEGNVSGEKDALPWLPGRYTGPSQRRRLTVQLDDYAGVGLVIPLLDDASDRQRITLLRSLMIAGCVLHELDHRFPRLLASMPEAPATLDALQQLAVGLMKERGLNMPDTVQTVLTQPKVAKMIEAESDSGTSVVRRNMQKLM